MTIKINYACEDLEENETIIPCIKCENVGEVGIIRIMHSNKTPRGDPWLSEACNKCGHTNGY